MDRAGGGSGMSLCLSGTSAVSLLIFNVEMNGVSVALPGVFVTKLINIVGWTSGWAMYRGFYADFYALTCQDI